MRIISPFRDYYDGIAQAYYDPGTVYVRKPRDQEMIMNLSHREDRMLSSVHRRIDESLVNDKGHMLHTQCFPIFLTGKLYFTFAAKLRTAIGSKPVNMQFLSYRDLFKYQEDNGYNNRRYYHDMRETFQETWQGTEWDYNERFNSPVVVLTEVHSLERRGTRLRFETDTCLVTKSFAGVMDANTVFQEINMWMNSKFTKRENQIAEVSNDVRLQQHGFDKHSFRKAPEKKV